jgi:putative NIF3 family GTP cyclohydrolase 1 type 2
VYHAAVTNTVSAALTTLAFVLLCGSDYGAAAVAPSTPAGTSATAAQVVERIKSHVGVPWQAGDTVFAAKMAFIREHHLVVWRFHDHWHARQPDGVQAGMLRALGWSVGEGQAPEVVTRPESTLSRLAADIRTRLDAHALRVVGRPDMTVTKIALAPGAAGFAMHRAALQRDDVQVLVIGEAREWETVEYVEDAIAAGQNKALVIIGHIPSEQAGMEECVRWLKGFVTEVPVDFVAAADPFWYAR